LWPGGWGWGWFLWWFGSIWGGQTLSLLLPFREAPLWIPQGCARWSSQNNIWPYMAPASCFMPKLPKIISAGCRCQRTVFPN
jgi:hypothetical protein